MQADNAVSRSIEPLADVSAAIRDVLDHPAGNIPLAELAGPGKRVCIVFTDITRGSLDHLLVQPYSPSWKLPECAMKTSV